MLDLLRFEWERDLGGYQIEPAGEAAAPQGGNTLNAAGGNVLRYKPLTAHTGLFREFAETALTPDGAKGFADRYGLLGNEWAAEPLSLWFRQIELMAQAVEHWDDAKQSGDFRSLAGIFDMTALDRASVMLDLPRPATRPHLRIVPGTLQDALWLQFAQAITNDVQIQRCANCPAWFAYGAGTGKRKSSKYCADRCRKVAHRQRTLV